MSRIEFIEYLIGRYSNYSLGNDEPAYRLIGYIDSHLKSTEENLGVEDSRRVKRSSNSMDFSSDSLWVKQYFHYTTSINVWSSGDESMVSQAIALLELIRSSPLILILGILKAFILVLLPTISRSGEKMDSTYSASNSWSGAYHN